MKRNFFSFTLTFAFSWIGSTLLTACGSGVNCYDMFSKVYTIDSTTDISLTIDGRTQNNWEQWVKDNFNNIEHGQDATAEVYIQNIKNSLTVNLLDFEIKIEKTSDVDNVRKGTVTIIKQGQENLVFNAESKKDEDYAGSYLEGNLFLPDQTDSVGRIMIKTADYGKSADAVYLNFNIEQQYYTTHSHYGINMLNSDTSINLMKIAKLKNVSEI